MAAQAIDLHEELAEAKVGKFHWRLGAIMGLLTLFDGYDTFNPAYVIHYVAKPWGLQAGQAGDAGDTAGAQLKNEWAPSFAHIPGMSFDVIELLQSVEQSSHVEWDRFGPGDRRRRLIIMLTTSPEWLVTRPESQHSDV